MENTSEEIKIRYVYFIFLWRFVDAKWEPANEFYYLTVKIEDDPVNLIRQLETAALKQHPDQRVKIQDWKFIKIIEK